MLFYCMDLAVINRTPKKELSKKNITFNDLDGLSGE